MKKLILSLIFASIYQVLIAQPVNEYSKNVMMASPTAASLGKYTDIPVSYYSGVPNIGIPITTVTEGSLSLPVSLSYHASGVKVGEAPSWIGQNWTLNAGGMISRTVQSRKDEEGGQGWLYSGPVPEPPVFNQKGIPIDGEFCEFYDHVTEDTYDSEPDLFSFNFAGYGGKFYFKKDGSVVLVPQQDLRVVPKFTGNTSNIIHLKGFVITTQDGTKYYFGDVGDEALAVETTTGGGGDYPEIPSGWYLRRIESADFKDTINLYYIGEYSSTSFQPNRTAACTQVGPGYGSSPNQSSMISWIKGYHLYSIETTNTIITFHEGASREDLDVYPLAPYNSVPPKVLDSISITSGPYKQVFDFTYDYWVDNSSDQVTSPYTKLNKRLRLLSVQEKSGDGAIIKPAWSFDYFAKSGSPDFMPHRISRSVDHWGFFNEKNNGAYTSIEANIPGNINLNGSCIDGDDCSQHFEYFSGSIDRNTNETAMKYGTLKKITYPTGGYTEFDFEANDYYSSDPPYDTISLFHIDGAYSSGGFSCNAFQFYGNPPVMSFSASTLNAAIYTWKLKPNTSTCNCVNGVTSLRVKALDPVTWQVITQSAVYNMGCTGTTTQTGLLSNFFVSPALQPNVDYRFELEIVQGGGDFEIRLPVQNNMQKVGGLRVKQIKTHDGISSANDIIRTYEYKDSVITSRSSGILYGKPNYVHSYSWFPCDTTSFCGSFCAEPECLAYQLPSGGCNVNFYETSITPLSSFEGYHIGYYYVKENYNGNGSKSYTYYTEISNDPPVYPAPPEPARILAGNLRYSRTINSAGITIATESHSANDDAYTESTDVMYKKVVSQCGRFLTVYKIRTRPYREKAMANTIDGVTTKTEYGYDTNKNHLQMTTEDVTNSDGTIYRTKYKYAFEYNCGPTCDETNGVNDEAKAIFALFSRHINLPIEQTNWIKKTGWGAFQLTKATYFQYDKVNTSYDNVKLKAVQQILLSSPLASFTESYISGGVFTKSTSPAYSVEYNFAFSDVHGKLLSQWKENNPAKEQYIWSHTNKLPIAKVINAEQTEIAFTSFEQNDFGYQGYWSFTGASGGWNNDPGNFYTGRTGFNLSPARTMVRNGLPAGTYLVSGWHKDGSFVVNGTTVSSSTGGQWKFAEKEITLVSPGNITVSSGGSDWSQFVDEVRLYPTDALMQTVSFDDRDFLMLSMADENSVPAHYEYDALQRLQAVRDQDRFIKQTYEYNYHGAGSVINDVKSRNVLLSGQTTIAQVNALSGPDVNRVFQFMDGVGRPIQTNAVAQSPTGNDIITYQAYDNQNREPKQYIPYTITSNGGAYRTNAFTEQRTFAIGWGSGGYGYGETRFEVSPLNRPFEQSGPGATWKIGDGHTKELSYRSNNGADAVRDFANGNFFANDLLRVTQEIDENEHKKWTFTDKLGRIILVKQELNATEIAQTYTLYDDFKRVSYIIPPETVKRMINSGNWVYGSGLYFAMIFKYTYDNRGNMVTKAVPSGGTTLISYDRLDRPVLTMDGNGFKLFTRYDILSRPVVSGKYNGTSSPSSSDPLFESPNHTAPHYYTNLSFPTDNNIDVYKVMYYDDYDFDNNGTLGNGELYIDPAESGYESSAFMRTHGKTTATKVGILFNNGAAPATFLTTRTYYDKEYSVIQVNKQNHLSGADVTSNSYDFADRVVKTRRDHTATPPGGTAQAHTIREEYVYDDASRLRFTRHKIDANNWVVTAAPVYDELNRLADKRLHASNYDGVSNINLSSNFNYLQSLDYTYNIRGWLTAINDPTNGCAVQNGDQLADLFNMSFEYETSANGGTIQYNGNISTIQWNTNINGSCNPRNLYRFSYDFNNRLTTADYRAWSGAAWIDPSKYTENNITYDLNGNLKTYFRRGSTPGSTIDNLTYAYGDTFRPDRLTNMLDAGDATKGFIYTVGAANYQYDFKGNLTQDNHKKFSFAYNFMNLPHTIIKLAKGANTITITYTADGEKLSKATTGGQTKSYVSGIEYSGLTLEAIYFAEGRCTPNGGTAFNYDYTIKDHLGNARENFRANGAGVIHLEDMHYYPFGMLMEGMGVNSPTNDYTYNGKELNEDFGLGLYDYGARWYDAAIGRWWNVDPLSEGTSSYSTYQYVLNNPLTLVDPFGMSPQGAKENAYSMANWVSYSLSNDRINQLSKAVSTWYKDNDGSIQYSPIAQTQNDLAKGQTYLGESFTGKGESGKMIYYNYGGSIFFKSETDAYNYMWYNAEKTKKEHLGVVFADGVAVLPIYNNDGTTSQIEFYGFRFEHRNGKTYLASDNYTHKLPVLGTVHMHNANLFMSDGISHSDIAAFGTRTPGRPAIVFENNESGKGGFLDGIIAYSKNDWAPIDRKSMPPLQNVLNGRASLIFYFKQIK
ncbi:MAG: DUF6443 domain-containing protein [Saprospiraceae bacterium]